MGSEVAMRRSVDNTEEFLSCPPCLLEFFQFQGLCDMAIRSIDGDEDREFIPSEPLRGGIIV